VLVTLALSFAAQNAVTALRMSAAQPFSAAGPAGGQRAVPAAGPARPPRHRWPVTIASTPAGMNASKPAGRRGENDGTRTARAHDHENSLPQR
jgi:hypothetical protein